MFSFDFLTNATRFNESGEFEDGVKRLYINYGDRWYHANVAGVHYYHFNPMSDNPIAVPSKGENVEAALYAHFGKSPSGIAECDSPPQLRFTDTSRAAQLKQKLINIDISDIFMQLFDDANTRTPKASSTKEEYDNMQYWEMHRKLKDAETKKSST